MNRILLCLALVLPPLLSMAGVRTSMTAQDAEREPVMAITIRNSTFFLVTDIELYTPQGENPFKRHFVRKGTKVELLAFSKRRSEFIKVRLEDGSLGFLPVSAFANATFEIGDKKYTSLKAYAGANSYLGTEVSDGKYSVVVSDEYVYEDYKELGNKYWTARPARAKLVGKRTYDITGNYSPLVYESFLEWKVDKYYKVFDDIYSRYDYGIFDSTLVHLPEHLYGGGYSNIALNQKYCYYPDKNHLNAFIGMHRKKFESQVGGPFAYRGPLLSAHPDSTYAIYANILWHIDKRHYYAGIKVKYDRDSIITAISEQPIDWTFKPSKMKKLKFPKASGKGGIAEAAKEKTSFSEWAKSAWEERFDFFAKVLGVYDDLALIALMILFQFIFAGLLFCFQALTSYGGDGWAKFRFSFPVQLYGFHHLIYLWKIYGLDAVIVFPLIIAAAIIPCVIVSKVIRKHRCPWCHKYVTPVILSSEIKKFHIKNFKELYSVRLDGRRSHSGGSMSGSDTRSDLYKCKTRMNPTQDVRYNLKCPSCHGTWNDTREVSMPQTTGPILIKTVDRTTSYSTTAVTERTEIQNQFGSILDSYERTDYKTDTWRDTHSYFIVDQRFMAYYRKYLNGDRDALNRYYRECWDDADLNTARMK